MFSLLRRAIPTISVLPKSIGFQKSLVSFSSSYRFRNNNRNSTKKASNTSNIEDQDDDSEILFWKPNMKPEDLFSEEELKEYYEAEKEFFKNHQNDVLDAKNQKEDTDSFLRQQKIKSEDLVGYNTFMNHGVDPIDEMSRNLNDEEQNSKENPLESIQFLTKMSNDIEQLIESNPEVKQEFDNWMKNFVQVLNKENETKENMSDNELNSICNIPKAISNLIDTKYGKDLKNIGISLDFDEEETQEPDKDKEIHSVYDLLEEESDSSKEDHELEENTIRHFGRRRNHNISGPCDTNIDFSESKEVQSEPQKVQSDPNGAHSELQESQSEPQEVPEEISSEAIQNLLSEMNESILNQYIGNKPSTDYSIKSYVPSSGRIKSRTKQQQQFSSQIQELLEVCFSHNILHNPILSSLGQPILIHQVLPSQDKRDITVLWEKPEAINYRISFDLDLNKLELPWFSENKQFSNTKKYNKKNKSGRSYITEEDIGKALNDSKGEIRYFLAKNLHMKSVPDIHFRLVKQDTNYNKSVEDILKEDQERQKEYDPLLNS